MEKKRRNKETYIDILNYVAFTLIILAFLGPLLWVLSISFKEAREVLAFPPKIIPSRLAWENYQKIFVGRIPGYLLNSFKLSGLTIIGVLLITIPAAYAFSRGKFKGKKFLLLGVLSLQMISTLIITIPTYRYFSRIGLINNHLGLVLIYIAVIIPLVTWIVKGFFDTIPYEIEESAMLDGCNRFQSIIKIILPLCGPGIFSALIFAFILSWSEFIIPFILISEDSLYPISIGIQTFQALSVGISTHYLAAGALICIIPPIVLFVFLQKYIIGGLTTGALKE